MKRYLVLLLLIIKCKAPIEVSKEHMKEKGVYETLPTPSPLCRIELRDFGKLKSDNIRLITKEKSKTYLIAPIDEGEFEVIEITEGVNKKLGTREILYRKSLRRFKGVEGYLDYELLNNEDQFKWVFLLKDKMVFYEGEERKEIPFDGSKYESKSKVKVGYIKDKLFLLLEPELYLLDGERFVNFTTNFTELVQAIHSLVVTSYGVAFFIKRSDGIYLLHLNNDLSEKVQEDIYIGNHPVENYLLHWAEDRFLVWSKIDKEIIRITVKPVGYKLKIEKREERKLKQKGERLTNIAGIIYLPWQYMLKPSYVGAISSDDAKHFGLIQLLTPTLLSFVNMTLSGAVIDNPYYFSSTQGEISNVALSWDGNEYSFAFTIRTEDRYILKTTRTICP